MDNKVEPSIEAMEAYYHLRKLAQSIVTAKVQWGNKEEHTVKTVKVLLTLAEYNYKEQGENLLIERGGYEALVTPGMWFVFRGGQGVDILTTCDTLPDSSPVPRKEELAFMDHIMSIKNFIDKWALE